MSARRISVVKFLSRQDLAGVHAYPSLLEPSEHIVQQSAARLGFRLDRLCSSRILQQRGQDPPIIADTVVPVSAALIRASLCVSSSTETLMVFIDLAHYFVVSVSQGPWQRRSLDGQSRAWKPPPSQRRLRVLNCTLVYI